MRRFSIQNAKESLLTAFLRESKMKKYTIFSILTFVFAICSGCAIPTVPGESFYKANITTIEIQSMSYEKVIEYKYEIGKFEKDIIAILKSKGYQVSVKPENFLKEIPLRFGPFVKREMAPNSKADAFMILNAEFTKKKFYSTPETKYALFEQITSMVTRSWLYNRNGELILIITKERKRKASPPLLIEGVSGLSITFYETENEFLYRIATELTENIPKLK